jgi:hypothetical protein
MKTHEEADAVIQKVLGVMLMGVGLALILTDPPTGGCPDCGDTICRKGCVWKREEAQVTRK